MRGKENGTTSSTAEGESKAPSLREGGGCDPRFRVWTCPGRHTIAANLDTAKLGRHCPLNGAPCFHPPDVKLSHERMLTVIRAVRIAALTLFSSVGPDRNG